MGLVGLLAACGGGLERDARAVVRQAGENWGRGSLGSGPSALCVLCCCTPLQRVAVPPHEQPPPAAIPSQVTVAVWRNFWTPPTILPRRTLLLQASADADTAANSMLDSLISPEHPPAPSHVATLQASADAGTAANSMLDSLTSMDEDQQVQQQDPNDPTKFFQQVRCLCVCWL